MYYVYVLRIKKYSEKIFLAHVESLFFLTIDAIVLISLKGNQYIFSSINKFNKKFLLVFLKAPPPHTLCWFFCEHFGGLKTKKRLN